MVCNSRRGGREKKKEKEERLIKASLNAWAIIFLGLFPYCPHCSGIIRSPFSDQVCKSLPKKKNPGQNTERREAGKSKTVTITNYTVVIHFTSKEKAYFIIHSELCSVSLFLLYTEDYITEVLNEYK